MENSKKEKALALLEVGECSKVYRLIKDDIESENFFALYLYSKFSLPEWHESAEKSDRRRIELLNKAAKGKIPEAAYQLACCYLYGEGIKRDLEFALVYAKESAALGYVPALILEEQIEKLIEKTPKNS